MTINHHLYVYYVHWAVVTIPHWLFYTERFYSLFGYEALQCRYTQYVHTAQCVHSVQCEQIFLNFIFTFWRIVDIVANECIKWHASHSLIIIQRTTNKHRTNAHNITTIAVYTCEMMRNRLLFIYFFSIWNWIDFSFFIIHNSHWYLHRN